MVVGTVICALLGVVGVLPIAVSPHLRGVRLGGVDVAWPCAAAFLTLVSTVLAYLPGIAAVRRVGASRAALIGLLEVVSATCASWLLLGERPAPVRLAGGALILAGVALTHRRGTEPPAPRMTDVAASVAGPPE